MVPVIVNTPSRVVYVPPAGSMMMSMVVLFGHRVFVGPVPFPTAAGWGGGVEFTPMPSITISWSPIASWTLLGMGLAIVSGRIAIMEVITTITTKLPAVLFRS